MVVAGHSWRRRAPGSSPRCWLDAPTVRNWGGPPVGRQRVDASHGSGGCPVSLAAVIVYRIRRSIASWQWASVAWT